jgi:MFS transporter, DHA3 family, macrolide efflux protein
MDSMHGWKARFFLIWTGQAFSLFGSSLAGFGVVWWMTQTTGSATVLALATMMTILPGVLLGPFAGALVDRWDRRVVMMVADTVAALAALALMLLFWAGDMQIWQVYTIMLVRSVAGAFHSPAMQASTSLLVPQEQLTRVAGLNQMLQGVSSIGAPPLAALLVTVLPLPAMMAIDVVTALIAVGTMSLVRVPKPPRSAEVTSVRQDVVEGLRYIWHWPGLRLVMVFACVINLLLTPAFSLMPILVTRHFEGGALQLAGMEAGMGIGIIVGGVLLGVWGGFKRRILTAVLGMAGMTAATLMIGLAPSSLFTLGVAGMVTMGVMSSLTNGPLFAIMQTVVAPEMQGRVFTVMGSISMGMSPIGLAFAGPLSDAFGVQSWYLVGSAAIFLLLIACLASPAIMRLEEGHSGQAGRALAAEG